MNEPYDSAPETRKHIGIVRDYIGQIVDELSYRAITHDDSKLEEPEKSVFDEWTPKLSGVTYGSQEYRDMLAQMKPAIDHHQSTNRHHPEYHNDGIRGMTLIDLVEMICDWLAATKRHADGDIMRSIEINQRRFGYSDELKQIFINTVEELVNG